MTVLSGAKGKMTTCGYVQLEAAGASTWRTAIAECITREFAVTARSTFRFAIQQFVFGKRWTRAELFLRYAQTSDNAGPGQTACITTDTDSSWSAPTSTLVLTASPTPCITETSRTDSSSTIFASTDPASTPLTWKRSRTARTIGEQLHSSHIAREDTNTRLRTHIGSRKLDLECAERVIGIERSNLGVISLG